MLEDQQTILDPLAALTSPILLATDSNLAKLRKLLKILGPSFVAAVQLDLDTEGFTYNKWGAQQVCRQGDWLVDNNGDKYTVSQVSFALTYELVSPGVYYKSAPVWAEVAKRGGKIKTKEGETEYKAGDYLVYNNEDSSDGYAMGAEKFRSMYEPAE